MKKFFVYQLPRRDTCHIQYTICFADKNSIDVEFSQIFPILQSRL